VDRVLKNARGNGGVISTDKRGSYVHSKQSISSAAREGVEAHIKSFPVNQSHYTRSHSSSRSYLSSDLSVSIMYNLYVKHCSDTSVVPVKEWYYRHIFNTRFNLSFHPPRKDTCKRCDEYKVQLAAAEASGDEAKTTDLRREHELHLRKAEAVRTQLHSEHNNDSHHEAFTFDLQKVLSLPRLTTNEVYYCRQLSVYNLGVHSLTSRKSTFFVWDETVASRGSQDIGSCLVKYCFEKAESGTKTLTAYSDSCGGQNRNHKIALLWMYVCAMSSIETINHKFMVSGHSYLPNDADFGIIERQTNKCSELYVPEQWHEIIEKCNRKNPFTVVRMDQQMFMSLENILKSCIHRKVSTDGSKVEWLKIQWMQIRKAEPLKLYYKYSVQNDMPFSCVDFGRKDREITVDHMSPAYSQSRPLSREKASDLRKLMKYIPPVYHSFYENKLVNNVTGEENESDITDCEGDVETTDSNAYNASRYILSYLAQSILFMVYSNHKPLMVDFMVYFFFTGGPYGIFILRHILVHKSYNEAPAYLNQGTS